MGRGYILVEGHGELGAVDNLIARLAREVDSLSNWAPASRWPKLHLQSGLERGAELVRVKPDPDALLVLRDEDDACPAHQGPILASWLKALQLPFPAAVVLFHPEYEVLFLPCVKAMAGKLLGSGPMARPGLRPEASWQGTWESRRGVKEWLTTQFPPNRSYKPTLDQLPLTRLLDFSTLRQAELSCFGTLERALSFLATGKAGEVYPALPTTRPGSP